MRRLAIAVVSFVLLVVAGPVQASVQTMAEGGPRFNYSGPVPLPETGAMFGTFVRPDDHTGENRREAMTNFEALVGRTMSVERVYNLWDDPFPIDDDLWSRDLGRTLYLSWNASPRDMTGCTPWAEIAAGLHDAEIDARAEMIKSFVAPLFFSFHHEPTTKPEFGGTCGTGEEFKAAFQRIRDRFDAAGVTNATYALTMTALSFQNNRGDEFYPGDDVVDLIAADGYNWFGCEFHQGPWREMDEIFRDFYDFGISKGKPMFIAEYGSGEDDVDPDKKAKWFRNGADLLKQWPEIKGVTYFNVGTGGACDRYVDSSPASLSAFQAMGADPYFKPPVSTTAVSATDFAFGPKTATVLRGRGAKWTFDGPSNHTVTDDTGMGMFDTGSQSAGSTFTYFFIGAGKYDYVCTIHEGQGMKGRVQVPAGAMPRSGTETTTFTVVWAGMQPPGDRVFDVQIKRPGSAYVDWLTDQTAMSATFVPDSGPGTYSFRARYRDSGTGLASKYSNPVSIVVN
jgi:plastocyanin